MHPFPNLMFARGFGAVTLVASGSGSSINTDYQFSTVGLQPGDYMFVFSDAVGDGDSAITGGTGTGWTLDTVIQPGGEKNRAQRKALQAGDVNTTLTCKVSTNATTVRYAAYRNVAKVDLVDSVASLANAPDITFTNTGNVTSALVAAISQHDSPSGQIIAIPTNWAYVVNQTSHIIARLDTLLYPVGSLVFTTGELSTNGQTGLLYNLQGY